jgi:hypothetical protein
MQLRRIEAFACAASKPKACYAKKQRTDMKPPSFFASQAEGLLRSVAKKSEAASFFFA